MYIKYRDMYIYIYTYIYIYICTCIYISYIYIYKCIYNTYYIHMDFEDRLSFAHSNFSHVRFSWT